MADTLLEHATVPHTGPDPIDLIHDHLERWLEILDGIELVWRTGAMPRSRFAPDFAAEDSPAN